MVQELGRNRQWPGCGAATKATKSSGPVVEAPSKGLGSNRSFPIARLAPTLVDLGPTTIRGADTVGKQKRRLSMCS